MPANGSASPEQAASSPVRVAPSQAAKAARTAVAAGSSEPLAWQLGELAGRQVLRNQDTDGLVQWRPAPLVSERVCWYA